MLGVTPQDIQGDASPKSYAYALLPYQLSHRPRIKAQTFHLGQSGKGEKQK